MARSRTNIQTYKLMHTMNCIQDIAYCIQSIAIQSTAFKLLPHQVLSYQVLPVPEQYCRSCHLTAVLTFAGHHGCCLSFTHTRCPALYWSSLDVVSLVSFTPGGSQTDPEGGGDLCLPDLRLIDVMSSINLTMRIHNIYYNKV